jgi:3-deoxy-manno-octulosonate cytidylyltransferase (CMP-KDO synthetase)
MAPKVVCVIPSRFPAQRFPGKPLALLLGKPMVQWVYEAAAGARGIDEVLVATDDDRIRAAVEGFGGSVIMTPPELPSGTDRIAFAMRGIDADIVVNVQGDEPGMSAATVQTALDALLATPDAHVGTACTPLHCVETFRQPHVVKVVRGDRDIALYFSREPIPSLARAEGADLEPGALVGYKHLGLYVYRREALEAFPRMPPSKLELREKLEQLRFMEAGFRIVCPVTPFDSIGVDLPEDVAKAEELLRKLGRG